MRGKSSKKIVDTGYADGAASHTNTVLKGWNPVKSSAVSDIDFNLDTLRSRSADQSINTPIGSAAITTSTLYTIGAGLRLFPRVRHKFLGLTPEQAREWNKRTAFEFELWANSCDIRGRNTFSDLQDILYRAYLTDGDAFVIMRRVKATRNNPYGLRLQAVEGNRVCNPQHFCGTLVNMEAPNGNRIINGIEIGTDGEAKAYWIANRVPYDPTSVKPLEWQRVQAVGKFTGLPNVLQICHDERPEQYRGVPYLAPVLEQLKQISRFSKAELTSAIVKSFFALFFVSQSGNTNIQDVLGASAYEKRQDDTPVVDPSEYQLGPGSLNALPKGVDVKSVNSDSEKSSFQPFVEALTKQIAAGLGQPYEVLMKTFNSSYSASRAALLQAWEHYKLRRSWFVRSFCRPVYETWLTEAIALGRVEAPGFFNDPLTRFAYLNAEWFGPSMSILDPVKDVNGSMLRVQAGLTTHEREAAEMTGTDFEENMEQLKIEQEIMGATDEGTKNMEDN